MILRINTMGELWDDVIPVRHRLRRLYLYWYQVPNFLVDWLLLFFKEQRKKEKFDIMTFYYNGNNTSSKVKYRC